MSETIAVWLKSTALSQVMIEPPWLWPICETLHFIGLALLVGAAGLFDLRLMGFLKRIPIAAAMQMRGWAAAGIVINLITGVLFFVSTVGESIRSCGCEFFRPDGCNSSSRRSRIADDASIRPKPVGTIVALHIGMFKLPSATASMSCPLCGRPVAPAADSTWVIAWYSCLGCGHEWSARIRNGQPDLPEVFVPLSRNKERA
jgi:hypothetical protein